MGKLTKVKKRSKTKTKKISSKNKPRSTKKPTSNSGAPEKIINDNIEDDSVSVESTPSLRTFRLHRRSMKVHHVEFEEKAIRKAQRALNRATNSGNQDEIEEAEEILDEAILEKKEASEWMDPTETIEKLNEILEYQIRTEQDKNTIEQTKEFISDAEESFKLINQGQEDAIFFQLIETNETMQEFEMKNESVIEELSEPQNFHNLPPIQHQSISEEQQNVSVIFSQEFSKQESENGRSDSDHNSMNTNDGQKTPVTGSSNKTINAIQSQINEALKILSPREKLDKMRRQAKLNATTRQSKLNQLWKNKTSKTASTKEIEEKPTSKNKVKEKSGTSKSSKCEKKSMEVEESQKSQKITESESQNESSNESVSDNEEYENDSNASSEKSEASHLMNEKKNKSTKQTKISISRQFNVYYSVKLNVEKGPIPTKQLEKALQAWYKQLLLMDPSTVIYAFESIIPSEAITSIKNIPSDFSIMKKYFNNISVKPNGGHTWFQVWMGHDESSDNLIMNMKHWSTESNTFIYKKRLQHKYTSKDYWLLWSTERMDTSVLHDEITTLIQRYSKQTFNFSFNFSFVRKDTKMSEKTPSKWNRAIVIEVKREEKDILYPILGRIFSTSNNTKVLGTDLRMIPMMNGDLPSHTKMKISHLIAKQEQFLSTLMIKPCVYLNEIDYFNVKLQTTMREIIMSLETLKTFNEKGEAMKIFQNVDYSTWHSCYVLTFPKHLEKEADDYIAQLPAYLHYVYGDEALIMMSAEGAVQAHSSKWDPEMLRATSKVDIELDAVASESVDKGWLPTLEMETIELDTSNVEWQTELHKRSTDADSISTFQPNKKPPLLEAGYEETDSKDDNDNVTPTKNRTTSSNNNDTNIISPNHNSFPNTSNDTIEDLQTRESEGQDDMKTPRIMASDLGASL